MFRLPRLTPSPEVHLDVVHAEIQALRGDQHRERRIELVEVRQHQRLGADPAVDVDARVEVADAGRGPADRFDRIDDPLGRREREADRVAVDVVELVPRDVVGQGAVGFALRVVELEEHRQHHVGGLLVALRQLAVGVERGLGLGQEPPDVAERGTRLDRVRIRGRALVLAEELGDVGEPRVDLGLGEEHQIADHLRPAGDERVGELRVDVARPGPAADVLDAGVVDGDDADAVGRRAVGGADAHVVGLALEALDEALDQACLGHDGEEEKDDRDRQAEKPVLRPETCLLHLEHPPVFLLSAPGARVACGGFYAPTSARFPERATRAARSPRSDGPARRDPTRGLRSTR